MIAFKNGKFEGGDLMDLIHIDWNDSPNSATWWDNMLYSEVAVLVIPENTDEMRLFEIGAEDLEFIPRQSEDFDEHYSTFWESKETYVFGDIYDALRFMNCYDGEFKKEVRNFLNKIQEEMLYNDAKESFQCTSNLGEDANPDFMNDLTDFVLDHNASMEEVLASMKLYMLDFYKTELQASRRYS